MGPPLPAGRALLILLLHGLATSRAFQRHHLPAQDVQQTPSGVYETGSHQQSEWFPVSEEDAATMTTEFLEMSDSSLTEVLNPDELSKKQGYYWISKASSKLCCSM